MEHFYVNLNSNKV